VQRSGREPGRFLRRRDRRRVAATEESPVNTRTIAIVALIIAVIVLVILLA
jgi:hypothetical protein